MIKGTDLFGWFVAVLLYLDRGRPPKKKKNENFGVGRDSTEPLWNIVFRNLLEGGANPKRANSKPAKPTQLL
jgi:hypothetical protein